MGTDHTLPPLSLSQPATMIPADNIFCKGEREVDGINGLGDPSYTKVHLWVSWWVGYGIQEYKISKGGKVSPCAPFVQVQRLRLALAEIQIR